MRALLTVLAVVLLMVGGAGAASAQASAIVEDAIEGLADEPVYVHPEAEDLLTAEEAEAIKARLLDNDFGPVYITVLPVEARDATGGDADALLSEIGNGLGRSGTYALVVGNSFRAGTTDGTPFAAGDVPAAATAATQEANGNVDTLLNTFVDELAAARDGSSESSGGISIVPVLVVAGLGFFGLRAYTRRRQQMQQVEEVRKVAEEDLTTFGNEIYELEQEFTMPDVHPEARADYDQAITEYQHARTAMAQAKRPQDLSLATESMERGRFAIACVRARLAGQPLPERRPPCFFSPTHGPSTREVEWSPDGGEPRPVPACEADAQRVERGEEPETRQITVGGWTRPYYDAPGYYSSYYGGYYGGFGGLGFLQGMMIGSMFGGGWGYGGAGYDGGHGADSGGFGGGDFGGGDFGGGDFGGGDFGGGDFSVADQARVYLEAGDKKVFATSVDWPGWSRSAKTPDEALATLVEYAERYRTTLGTASRGMPRPTAVDDLDVIKRVRGNASTDFGVPAFGVPEDDDIDDKDLRRQVRILEASWEAFDSVAAESAGAELRKGPRGGGRDVAKIVTHVIEADCGYLPRLGAAYRPPKGADEAEIAADSRDDALETIAVRSRGEPPPKPPRQNLWTLPYYIRRAAWHALDHAWEIEDRRL